MKKALKPTAPWLVVDIKAFQNIEGKWHKLMGLQRTESLQTISLDLGQLNSTGFLLHCACNRACPNQMVLVLVSMVVLPYLNEVAN